MTREQQNISKSEPKIETENGDNLGLPLKRTDKGGTLKKREITK